MRPRCTPEITGPTTVSGSSGSPTFSRPAACCQPGDDLVVDAALGETRVGAVQIWPEWKAHTRCDRRRSPCGGRRRRTRGAAPLPPSSSSWRFMPRPRPRRCGWPTEVDPVNETMSTCGRGDQRLAGLGAAAGDDVDDPGGNPASASTSPNTVTASGSCGAGFTTTVLPMASAGPTLPAMLTIGKLYGVMQATTPTGWRTAIAPMSPPAASAVEGISLGGSGIAVGSTRPWRSGAGARCTSAPASSGPPASWHLSRPGRAARGRRAGRAAGRRPG